jgi:hypothetical protein
MNDAFTFGQQSFFGHDEVTGFGSVLGEARIIDKKTADKVIRLNHYSGTVVNNTTEHIGYFVGGDMVGVLQFGHAMNPASGGSIVPWIKTGEWRELNRMWFNDEAPRNTESSAISKAIKLIVRRDRGVRFIQSFADERCGGLGVVYQASGFKFYGEHTSVFWELDGVMYHNIAMTVRGEELSRRKNAQMLQTNKDRAKMHKLRQFRYIRWLNGKAERDCLMASLPFPKRTLVLQ